MAYLLIVKRYEIYRFSAIQNKYITTRQKGALTASRLGASDLSKSDNLNGDGCVCARAMCLQYTIIVFEPG